MLKAHVWHVLCQLQCRLAPFPDCSVNHSMIKTVPLLPDALPQFFHVRDLVFVDVLLQSLPYHKLDRVYIRTVGWPHTHTRLTALCPGLPGWAGTRKVKPIWILLKQETVSGSGISWEYGVICFMLKAPKLHTAGNWSTQQYLPQIHKDSYNIVNMRQDFLLHIHRVFLGIWQWKNLTNRSTFA